MDVYELEGIIAGPVTTKNELVAPDINHCMTTHSITFPFFYDGTIHTVHSAGFLGIQQGDTVRIYLPQFKGSAYLTPYDAELGFLGSLDAWLEQERLLPQKIEKVEYGKVVSELTY